MKTIHSNNDESEFQKEVLKYLKELGGTWIKIHVSAYQKRGEPDIVGCYKGRFIALELKTETGKAATIQKYKLEKIKANGGIAMIINDLNTLIEESKKWRI